MLTIARVEAVAVATVPTDIVTVTTGRRLRHARRSGAPKAANRARVPDTKPARRPRTCSRTLSVGASQIRTVLLYRRV